MTTIKDLSERWLVEQNHKRTIEQDHQKLIYINQIIGAVNIKEIGIRDINRVIELKRLEGVSNATLNRYISLIKSILNKACKEWGLLDKVPYIALKRESTGRVRYLSKEEVNNILSLLPTHLRDMMLFTLYTGLRASNILNLKWNQIDIENKKLYIEAKDFKNNKYFSIPLNNSALLLLQKRLQFANSEHVFTYKGGSITQCNTRTWRNALKKANIYDFRWHDLRHTWASWHIQNGTTLEQLKELGGWSSLDMVLKYAHLSRRTLETASNNICEVLNVE